MLKRIASILFLLVLLFNFCGYRLVIDYLAGQTTADVERKVDRAEYADSELLSIKTTLHLPYYSSSPEFERAYGSITVNGVAYDYVKRRVYNDTLELLCLPNKAKTKLQHAGAEMAKAEAGAQTSSPEKKASSIKIALPEFFGQATIETVAFPALMRNAFANLSAHFDAGDYTRCPEQPPRSKA